MNLKLTRPLCGLDIESTGLDISKDRIITLAIIKVSPTQPSLPPKEERFEFKFNPGIPIPPEATEIHGITNEQAAAFPLLDKAHAEVIVRILAGCDLCGFNSNNFDLPILAEELHRAGTELNLEGVHLIDCGNLFKLREPRTLEAAVKFYCGREHTNAHNALGDVSETLAVLDGQIARYTDMAGMDVATLAKYSAMDDRIDLAGVIVRNKDGVPVFNTKRNKGVPVAQDIGYAEWFLRSDFTANTKAVIRKLLDDMNAQGGLFQ